MSSKNVTIPVSAANQFVGYVDDPDGRGTPSLVISCVLTLILCVWSALHLNVPPQRQSRWNDYIVSARWILAGIYAPELVVFTAWSQWSSARILHNLVDRTLAEENGDNKPHMYPSGRRFKWGITHSFFASTGGFAIDVEPLQSCLHDDNTDREKLPSRRLTLTARGVALLAACGGLPDVDPKQIEDKSKANDLAKATVLVQAMWMMVQVIGRLAARLPVTLLELNTVAHVLCAFAMYLFWWHKPLLPNEPLILRNDDFCLDPLTTFMYSSSELSGYVHPRHVKSKPTFKTLFASYFRFYSKTPEFETVCLRTKASDPDSTPDSTCAEADVSADPTINLDVKTLLADGALHIVEAPPTCIDRLRADANKTKSTVLFERRPRVASSRRPRTPNTSQADQTRWSLIIHAIRTYPDLLKDRIALAHTVTVNDDDSETTAATCVHLRPEQLLAPHVQNWPSHDLLRVTDGTRIGMVLWFANFAYGGVHAAAWGDHFPSAPERWLWRAAAAYVGWSGGLWVLLNLAVSRSPWLDRYWEAFVDGRKPWWQYLGLGSVMAVCGLSLVLARVYLLVEAFVSIRELPLGAYQTPKWSQVFPHF